MKWPHANRHQRTLTEDSGLRPEEWLLTHELLNIEPEEACNHPCRHFRYLAVVEVLGYLFAVRGIPEHLRSDNGPEFVARAVTRWLYQAGVKTLFIAKGSPWENGYMESFNSRFRDELLNCELFTGLADARWVVDRWRLDYNHHRPHSSLDYQTPAAFAARCAASAPERASATPRLSPPLQQHSGPLTPDSLIHTGTSIGGRPLSTVG